MFGTLRYINVNANNKIKIRFRCYQPFDINNVLYSWYNFIHNIDTDSIYLTSMQQTLDIAEELEEEALNQSQAVVFSTSRAAMWQAEFFC